MTQIPQTEAVAKRPVVRHRAAVRVSGCKQNAKVMYAGVAQTHIVGRPLGRLPRNKIRPSHIKGWVVGLRRKGLAESTIRSAYTILRAVLDAAAATVR